MTDNRWILTGILLTLAAGGPSAAGLPYLWVDLDTLPDGHWLRRPLTAGFNTYMALAATNWSWVYDAVLFIDVQRPATAISGLAGN